MKTDRSKPNEGTIVDSNPHSIPKTSKKKRLPQEIENYAMAL